MASLPASTATGFFSLFLGTEEASAIETIPQTENSQTMLLLQTNSPAFLPLEQVKGDEVREDVIINIVSNNALSAITTNLSDEAVGGEIFADGEIEIYVVKQGDTLGQIANMFGISVNTIKYANNNIKTIREGDVLLIFPFDGFEHEVKKGDTLGGIANKYKANLDDILEANDLSKDSKLTIGEKLMVPGGEAPVSSGSKSSNGGSSVAKSSGSSISVGTGYFSNPLPGSRRTRGVTSSHRGVDFALPAGTPIHAAADGTVLIARLGYNGGFGNYVVVQHGNGTRTLYAHMSRLGTSPGAKVSKGEVIGYVGNTGRSRGAHLHFEVHGAKNPF